MMPEQPEHEDVLLDYETEADEAPAGVAEPIATKVCEPVVTVPTVAQHLTCSTVVLTSDAPYVQLLPLDPLRLRAQILLKGSKDIVICHSLAQAQDLANQASPLARPNGTIVSSGFTTPVSIETTQPVWAVGDASAGNILLGLIVERRT